MAHSASSDHRRDGEHAITKAAPLSDTFLNTLVTELDNDDIVGITLGGSHVRGGGESQRRGGPGFAASRDRGGHRKGGERIHPLDARQVFSQ